jgi:NADPH:quinone reductase-like Zn-dependent oxidoreductase
VVYDRTVVDFSKELWRETGKRGVDLIFDSVGQATWQQNLRSAARAGRIVVYGATTGPVLESDARLVFWKQLDILGTTMSSRREFEAVMALVFDGTLQPGGGRGLAAGPGTGGTRTAGSGRQFGKVVLRVEA